MLMGIRTVAEFQDQLLNPSLFFSSIFIFLKRGRRLLNQNIWPFCYWRSSEPLTSLSHFSFLRERHYSVAEKKKKIEKEKSEGLE